MSKKPEISVGSKVRYVPFGFDSNLLEDSVGTVVEIHHEAGLLAGYLIDFDGHFEWHDSYEVHLYAI